MADTQRERAAAKREDKLAEISKEVDAGRLTIRQMTPDERAKYGSDAKPPRRDTPRRRGGQR